MSLEKGKRLDFTIGDVNEVYTGPVGILWEMLMGEQIHVGGDKETDILAQKAGIAKDNVVLDVCSALGGPARYLVKRYGCQVTGLDATEKMINEAIRRTEKEGLTDSITYKLGNALDMPFKAGSFDIVWGQDAWCYVTDKNKLMQESYRVLKPQGIVAFTDWLQVGNMSAEEWESLNSFMAFPYMETLEGYEGLMKNTGLQVLEKEDLSKDFTEHCHLYQKRLQEKLKDGILKQYGAELFQAADDGLSMWVKAADEGKVGRGRLIGKKSDKQARFY